MTTITAVLGGEKKLGHRVRKWTDFDFLIREGFPYRVAVYIKEKLDLTDSELSKMLGISLRTLSRLKKEAAARSVEKLSSVASDRLYRLARIYACAEDVLEDRDQAVEWLHSPQFGLGGRIPLEMIQTEAGSKEVEDLLGRIEYGVVS